MKRVIRYKTSDGKLFKSKKNAQKHEQIVEDAESAIRLILPKRFDTLAFTNGEGFLKVGEVVRQEFYARCYQHFDKFHELGSLPFQGAGRILQDSGSPSYQLWEVAQRIDSQNRLWGQPYFAINPKAGKQVQLNK